MSAKNMANRETNILLDDWITFLAWNGMEKGVLITVYFHDRYTAHGLGVCDWWGGGGVVTDWAITIYM